MLRPQGVSQSQVPTGTEGGRFLAVPDRGWARDER